MDEVGAYVKRSRRKIAKTSRRRLAISRKRDLRNDPRRVALAGLRYLAARGRLRSYQPLMGVEPSYFDKSPKIQREGLRRFEKMAPHLPDRGSYLDVGSANGWFVFTMAQRGYFSVGIDANEDGHLTAELLQLYNNQSNCGFVKFSVDPGSVKYLPSFDIVSCFSVFHHWARRLGLDNATEIMQGLADRTKQQLYFETGQSNETTFKWYKDLAFMGDRPDEWIDGFLRKLGFREVTQIGTSPSRESKDRFKGEKKVERHLFLAEK